VLIRLIRVIRGLWFDLLSGEQTMSTTATPPKTGQPDPPPPSPIYSWVAVGLAAVAAAGGLYLNLVEEKMPCPLCFYQRGFAYATLGIMVVGLLTKLNERVSVATLALPVAFAGLGVALWHVQLIRNETLICPLGITRYFNAPQESAIIFGLLCSVLMVDAYQLGRPGCEFQFVVGGVAAGLALAGLSLLGNPPPQTQATAEDKPETVKTCMKAYKAEK
jgi:hypothetical protein